jgi:hypothetical protein
MQAEEEGTVERMARMAKIETLMFTIGILLNNEKRHVRCDQTRQSFESHSLEACTRPLRQTQTLALPQKRNVCCLQVAGQVRSRQDKTASVCVCVCVCVCVLGREDS